MRHQRAPFQMRSCSLIEQTEEVENCSSWTEEETHGLIRLRGDGSVEAKLQGIDRNKCHHYMTSHTPRAGRRRKVVATATCQRGQ